MENYKANQFGPFTVGGNYSSALLPAFEYRMADGKKAIENLTSDNPPRSGFEKALQGYVTSILHNPQEASGGCFAYPAQAEFSGSGTGAEGLGAVLHPRLLHDGGKSLRPEPAGRGHRPEVREGAAIGGLAPRPRLRRRASPGRRLRDRAARRDVARAGGRGVGGDRAGPVTQRGSEPTSRSTESASAARPVVASFASTRAVAPAPPSGSSGAGSPATSAPRSDAVPT